MCALAEWGSRRGGCRHHILVWVLVLWLGFTTLPEARADGSGAVRDLTAQTETLAPRQFVTLCFAADVAPEFFGGKRAYFDAMRKLPETQQRMVRRLYYEGIYVTFEVTAGIDPPQAVYITRAGSAELWNEENFSPEGHSVTAEFNAVLDERNLWRVNLLPDLEYLNLLPSQLCARGLLALENENMRALSLPALSQVSDDDLAAFVRGQCAPHLEHLDLPTTGNAVTPAAIGKLFASYRVREGWHSTAKWRTCSLDQLKSLHLLGPRVTDEWLRWIEGTAVSAGQLSEADNKGEDVPALRLRGLGLRATSVSDAGLRRLRACVNLTHLALIDCRRITAEGLRNLRRLPNLEELHLLGGQFTDDCVSILKDIPKLRVLVLDYSPITDKGLATMRSFENLEFVSVVGTKVTAQEAIDWEKTRPHPCRVRTKRAAGAESIQGWIQGIYGRWDDGTFMPRRRDDDVRQ